MQRAKKVVGTQMTLEKAGGMACRGTVHPVGARMMLEKVGGVACRGAEHRGVVAMAQRRGGQIWV